MRPRIIAVANQKGGVGKTTTTINIAGSVAQQGKRVLIVDCDPQGNATTSLGIDKRELQTTLYDVLLGETTLAAATLATGRQGLAIVPADQDLVGAAVELAAAERREWRLADALATVEGDIDLVLIDCPPSLGVLTLNALCAASDVLIPMQCEYLALEGLAQLKSTIDRVREHLNPRLAISGVVMTMYDGRTNLSQQVVDEVQTYFPKLICRTLISRSVRLSEAPSYGQLISEYDPHSKSAQAYAALADEVIQREGRLA